MGVMIQLRQWLHQHLNDTKPGETPARQMWAETLGFFIIFFGVFMLIALVGYDSADVGKLSSGDKNLTNLVGPLGAMIAHFFIQSIGAISYIWPPAFILWGVLLATGIIIKPKKRRFIIFVLVSISMAAMAEVLYPQSELVYGQGGRIGEWLGQGTSNIVGKVGTILFFAFTTIASLIFTRNMSFSFSKNPFEKRPESLEHDNFNAATAGAMSPQVRRTQDFMDLEQADSELTQSPEEGPTSKITLQLGPNNSAPAKPNTDIFESANLVVADSEDDALVGELLTSKLEEFKVKGSIEGVTLGPVVKTYEFEPKAGTKVAKIEALQSDLARLLKTESLRVVLVPGASTVGFEVPNPDRKIIPFGNLVSAPEFKSRSMNLPIAMGVDCFGKPVIEDLASMPHLMVAGATGSGKSVFVNTLITSLMVRNSARDLRMVLIDPKMVELGMFNDTAHLACPVVTDIENDGLPVLQQLVDQMEQRYKYLNQTGAKNITAFNKIIKTEKKSAHKKYQGKWQTMPYVVVIVDEFADLMMGLGKEAEVAITRLAQKARAAGIHLVIATQRPSVQVVTGTIKANFPTRVAFKVTSAVDSRTILDQSGAESLLGRGDMLYLSPTGLKRLHSGFLTDDELKKMVKACKGRHKSK